MPDQPTRPPYDAELTTVVTRLRGMRPPLHRENLAAQRQSVLDGVQGAPPVDLTAGGRVRLDERTVPGPTESPEVTLLILRPAAGIAGPLPAIYHIHGGGMVLGDRRTGLDRFLSFVVEGRAAVVSVEYRLAPEHPDPAPVEDCYAGLAWLARHADEYGIDAGRLMVAGVSAGGGLAAGVALLARDRRFPDLSHQVLLCPMLDDRFQTLSSRMLDGDGTWDRNSNEFGWTALLGDRRGGPDVSPYAAPARATDLAGLPRTFIDVGSVETFRDECLHYARRLSEAGVSVDLHMWGGGFHGFDYAAPGAALAQAANATRDAFIRRALAG
jgi:acetyl esterase/lipase